MATMTDSIAQNLQRIREDIATAAAQSGRSPHEIRLIAVSKTKPMEALQAAAEVGQLDFGENKVQELSEKQAQLPHLQWHMIGNLQRNKVKYLIDYVHLIHSVDSPRLLKEVSKRALKAERMVDVLLQLNISEEDSKSGLNESTTAELLDHIDDYPSLRVRGLMGMAAFSEDEKLVRSQFARLRRAFEDFQGIEHPRIEMAELSMGMSNDFAWAIAEGSTMVRIGSAIFGARSYS